MRSRPHPGETTDWRSVHACELAVQPRRDGGTGRDESMGPRRVSIKVKLAGALAVPLVALTVVSGLEVARSLDHAHQVRRQTDLATAAIGPSGLITALQNERNFTGLWLLGADEFVDRPVRSLSEARKATDTAREAFAKEVE